MFFYIYFYTNKYCIFNMLYIYLNHGNNQRGFMNRVKNKMISVPISWKKPMLNRLKNESKMSISEIAVEGIERKAKQHKINLDGE